jgi:ubiquinone/menaquinone biosynthesis C-methylase UbiE
MGGDRKPSERTFLCGDGSDLASVRSLGPSYDDWYESCLGRFVDAVEWDALLNLLRPKPAERILDIGSGTGRNARRLAKLGVRALGLEPSAGMLAVARECSAGEPPSYLCGVAEALPFSDGVFDAVLTVTTLEFVIDVEVALSEAARVTKAGGRVVIGTLSSKGPWAAGRRRSGDALWTAARFFSEREIKMLLEPFGPVKTHRAVYVPPGAGRLPSSMFLLIEWLGHRAAPSAAAFIAAHVDIRRQS